MLHFLYLSALPQINTGGRPIGNSEGYETVYEAVRDALVLATFHQKNVMIEEKDAPDSPPSDISYVRPCECRDGYPCQSPSIC